MQHLRSFRNCLIRKGMRVDKTEWKSGTIDEYCIIQLGTRIVRKDVDEGEFPVYGGGGATFTTSTYNRENAILISRFAISKECTRFVQGRFFLNDSGLTIIPKGDTLLFHYLKWHIFAINDKIYSLGKGVAQKNLDMKRFPFLLLNIPPIDEQQVISSELDSIQTMIDGYNALLEDLDALAQSIFFDTFGDPTINEKGWGLKKLCEVCEVTSSKRIYQSEQTKSGVPFYRISDFARLIRNEAIFPELYISHEKYNELKSKNLVPCKNDILITSRGTLGLCYVIKGNDCFYFQDGMITWLKNIKEGLSSTFLSYIFKTSFLKRQMQKAQNGSTVSYLSISMIKGLDIIIPPLPLQQQFAERVESIELQKELIRKQLTDAEQLMGERMHYYFS